MKRILLVALGVSVALFGSTPGRAQEPKARSIQLSEETNPQREKARLQLLASLRGVACVPATRTEASAVDPQSLELRFSEAGRAASALELKNPGREPVEVSLTIPEAAGAQSVSFTVCPQATVVIDLGRVVPPEQDRAWVKLRGDVAATIVLRNEAGTTKQRFDVATDFEVNRLLIFASPEDRYQLESELQPAAVESNFKLRDGSSAHSVREEAGALSVLEPPGDAERGVVRLAFGRRMRGGASR